MRGFWAIVPCWRAYPICHGGPKQWHFLTFVWGEQISYTLFARQTLTNLSSLNSIDEIPAPWVVSAFGSNICQLCPFLFSTLKDASVVWRTGSRAWTTYRPLVMTSHGSYSGFMGVVSFPQETLLVSVFRCRLPHSCNSMISCLYVGFHFYPHVEECVVWLYLFVFFRTLRKKL